MIRQPVIQMRQMVADLQGLKTEILKFRSIFVFI